MRYIVKELRKSKRTAMTEIRVFEVHDSKEEVPFDLKDVQVWFDASVNTVRCTKCSSSLVAMIQTCAHANAVKRHLRREGALPDPVSRSAGWPLEQTKHPPAPLKETKIQKMKGDIQRLEELTDKLSKRLTSIEQILKENQK